MQIKNTNFYNIIGFILFMFFLIGCNAEKEILLSGATMDTSYHIKLITRGFVDTEDIKEKIDESLEKINESMSIYRMGSEISRFNALDSIGEKFYISDDFMTVLCMAEKIYELSNGSLDCTIKPLVQVWRFEGDRKIKSLPSEKKIEKLLSQIGFSHVLISRDGYLKKKKKSITLDMASIAKGYAVDQVSALIKSLNIKNFLVEIGGEVYASGVRIDGKEWKVGINRPEKKGSFDQIYKVVSLKNRALATSGDYRNYFEYNGKTYSHILDPQTGYPVTNNIVSVSIMADSCALADGFATAVMVLGHCKGIELINSIKSTECLIIVKDKNGGLIDYYSNGFL